MAYIGKTPIVGNFQKCDAITVVNGQAAYTLQVSSTNVVPESANHMLVSLNGILQAPVTSFTVSSSTLTFASNLATGDVIDFVILLGNVLDLGTVSDNTIATAKIQDDAITLAKMASGTDGNIISYDASGNPVAIATGSDGQVLTSTGAGSPPAFEALSAGKILQVVEGDLSTKFETNNSSSHQATGLDVDITCSATSSKVFVLTSFQARSTDTNQAHFTIYRDSTNLAGGDVHFVSINSAGGNFNCGVTMQCLDSPSSTSALTYQVYCYHASGGGAYAVLNDSAIAAKITVFEIGA